MALLSTPAKRNNPLRKATACKRPIISILALLTIIFLARNAEIGLSAMESRTSAHRQFRYAFLTLLCGDTMAEASMVLIHSIKKTGTLHEIVVLTMNSSRDVMNSLNLVGAKVIQIDQPVRYPFEQTAGRISINKPCRYSKLLIWNMTEYEKIVFLDSDMLVLANIDKLFELPSFSAAPDLLPPDKFNSGLMVIEPNKTLFADMIQKVESVSSPNVGDQGFLNNYFTDWYSQERTHSVSISYNSLVRSSLSPAWLHFVNSSSKVMHFSGNGKPWNRVTDTKFPSNKKYDILWLRMLDSVKDILSASSESREGQAQCSRKFMKYQKGDMVGNKLSVLINTFDCLDMLNSTVYRYASLDFVHRVYINWGSKKVPPFQNSHFKNAPVPVEVLHSSPYSINSQFKPIQSLQTEALLICDDNIEADELSLRVAFDRWMENKHRLVGFFPRAHYFDAPSRQFVYVTKPHLHYSMVLTKLVIVHGDYLHLYTCSQPSALLSYTHSCNDCADIALNMLALQMSTLTPLLVFDSSKVHYEAVATWAARGVGSISRSRCLNDLVNFLGTMPLRNTSDAAVHFHLRLSRWQSRRTTFNPTMSARGRFMESLPYVDHHHGTEAAYIPAVKQKSDVSVLCLRGNASMDALQAADVHSHAVVPYQSLQAASYLFTHGTTLIAHESRSMENGFNVLQLASTLFEWRREHGCFAPSNILVVGVNSTVAQLSPWGRSLLRFSMGSQVRIRSGVVGDSAECFESAVVIRERPDRRGPSEFCRSSFRSVRSTVIEACRMKYSQGQRNQSVVRVAIMTSPNWIKTPAFNHSSLRAAVLDVCAASGLTCQVFKVPAGSFCRLQVLGVNGADIVVGFWKDVLMSNAIFLEPGGHVVEIIPPLMRKHDFTLAMERFSFFGLSYEQVHYSQGFGYLLQRIGDRTRQKRTREVKEVLLERACVNEIAI